MNDNISTNNISLNMVWKYKLTIVVSSVGNKAATISSASIGTIECGSSQVGHIYTKYVPEGESVKISIPSRSMLTSDTKVTWDGTSYKNNFTNSVNKTLTMPNKVVEVKVEKA